MIPTMEQTPHLRVVVRMFALRGISAVIISAGILVVAMAMSPTAWGQDTRPAVSPALVASALDKALAMSHEADRDEFLASANLKKLAADVRSARELWQRTQDLLEQCRKRHVILEPAIAERAEIGRILFLKRFGPIGPARAVDRLVAVSNELNSSNFRLDALISWFAQEAWTEHCQGNAQHLLANGKLSKPAAVGGGRREQALAKKYYRTAARYALRAARINPNDPNVGWLLWAIPSPSAYNGLRTWGACLLLARHTDARWWCYGDFYSPGNLRSVLENVRANLKVLAPETLAAIRAGNWKNRPPHIPSWSEFSKALERENAKR
jgi:hypothetical protein